MDRATQHRRASRTRDRALVLLIVGTVILMPPVAGIFQSTAKLGGIPVTLHYLFLVWSLLIAGTAILSRALVRSEEARNENK